MATAGFIAACGLSVWLAFADRIGGFAAAASGLVAAAVLAIAARRHTARMPSSLRVDEGGVTLFFQRRPSLHFERVESAANWSGHLLAVSLVQPGVGRRSLVLAADAFGPGAFRELAWRIRRIA